MGKTLNEIEKALPGIDSEEVAVVSEELDKILAIKKLFSTKEAKVLLEVLRDNCSSALRKAIIAAKKGDNPIPFILDYSANIDLLSTSQDISMEKELREQLDDAVRRSNYN